MRNFRKFTENVRDLSHIFSLINNDGSYISCKRNTAVRFFSSSHEHDGKLAMKIKEVLLSVIESFELNDLVFENELIHFILLCCVLIVIDFIKSMKISLKLDFR